jgi:4-amino-4-deoxy-L-arabinose transferase-like glycosyltransferase
LLLLAGALAGLSALTKYFGVSLIPLMLAVALVHRRGRPGACLFAMLIPIAMLIAYEIWTNRLYFPGKFILHGHLADALFYSADYRARMGTQRLGALATGWCLPVGLAWGLCRFLIGGMNRWGWITTASIAVIILALVALINRFRKARPLRGESGLAVGYFVQFAALCVVGTGALVLAGAGLRHWRLSDSVLLALWVLGTFVFAAMVNWSVNGRSILPMVPAAAIIVCRQMDRCASGRRDGR